MSCPWSWVSTWPLDRGVSSALLTVSCGWKEHERCCSSVMIGRKTITMWRSSAEDGRRLVRKRLPEGLEGITRLHGLIAGCMPEEWAELPPGEAAALVKVGIETDRGPWVAALVAAGYEVFAINPKSSAHYRGLHSSSGAKSDRGDAHVLAEIVRLDRAHHRPIAADSAHGESVKLVARAHQSMVWERTRHVLRLRSALREFFPAALAAYGDLDEPDTLQLLTIAPDPDAGGAPVDSEDQRRADAGEPAQRGGSRAADPGRVTRPGAAPTWSGAGRVRRDRR